MSDLKIDTPLTANQIDFRVQSINKGGYCTILAYKDARVDYHRLNAVYGVGNWQRKHSDILGRLYCSIGLWHKDSGTWAWVQDVGTESYTEKEKGQASDSFKRACFNLGIGAELYDYPLIQIKLKDNEFELNNGKPKQTWNLKLREWTWYNEFDNGILSVLAAKDEKGAMRYQYKIPSTTYRFKKGEKDETMRDVLEALTSGNGETIRSILSDYDSPESQMAFWALFKSGERSAMKKLIEQ
jgi:hypothetical protein